MTTSGLGDGHTRASGQVAALRKLSRGPVTPITIAKHEVLLTLVGGADAERAANTLFHAFEEIAREARASVLAPQGAETTFDRVKAEWIAAAAEMLGLTDEEQLHRRVDSLSEDRAFFWASLQGTVVMRRKRRALAWAGDARAIRTAERNAKECWYPAFLAAAELYLRDGMTGSSSPEELGPVTETNPTDNQDIIDNLSRSASDLPLGYIRREHEEAQLRELIAQKARIIAIVGQPGMGKSWLAMALLAIGLPGSTPVIRFERGQIYLPDLRAALDDAGVKGGGKNPDKTETDLVRLLCSKRAPQFVVLDNLTSTSELTFIPSHARSTIIATCRTSDDSKPLSCQLVRIGAMTQAEALTLVRSRLPSLDDQSSNAVVEAFDRHPLVISIACGLLELDAVSVEELCRSITDQAGDATTSGETLREIFGRMIEALKQRDRLATAALTFLSFVGDVPEIDLRVLRRYLRAVRSSVTPYEFVKALKLLTHLCLVDIVAGAASMHIVTRSVLHDIFHERFDFVVDRTLLMLHEYQQGRVPHLVGEVDLQEMWSLNLVMISVASQVVRRAEEDGEFRALRRSLVELAMLITQVAEEYRLRSSALARDLGFEMDPHWEQWLRERLPSLDTD